jgi:hypothetical protein
MKTILWLDDIRDPFVIKEWIYTIQYLKEEYLEIEDESCEVQWVKTQIEFEKYIKENGLPDLISFDNDLGIGNGEGYDCAKWLVEYCMDNNVQLPKWFIHSANPVAKENIKNLLINFENNYYGKI